jgi:hypothetical protein
MTLKRLCALVNLVILELFIYLMRSINPLNLYCSIPNMFPKVMIFESNVASSRTHLWSIDEIYKAFLSSNNVEKVAEVVNCKSVSVETVLET